MPIIGLTDQAAAFPIIGTLRKGEKKTSESKPGADLTYLRFVSDDPLAERMFSDAYPDQDTLRNIHVFLPFKTTGENFDAWIEEWVAGGLVHRCDGQTQVLWRTPAGGYSAEPRPCQNCRGKQVGRLAVIVPELGRLATVTVMTTSKHDIINLTKQLRSYEAMRGDLRGIPFVLRRRQFKISTPGQGDKRVRREKWLLSIETQPEWSMLQMTAMQQAALPEVVEGEIVTVQIPANVNPFENGFDAVEEPEPEAEQAPTNGHAKPARPYSPETVKAGITARTTNGGRYAEMTDLVKDQRLDYLNEILSKACGDEDQKWLVTYYLCGAQSLGNLTNGQASALIDWIGATAENEYGPNPATVQEIELIVQAVKAEALAALDKADEDEMPF